MSWKRTLVAVLVVTPIVVLLAFGLTRDPRAIPSPMPGRSAPDFELAVMPRAGDVQPTTREVVSLASLRGNVVVLNFWASWCLPCRDEHEDLSATAQAYADAPVRFLGVLYNDAPGQAREWIRMMGGQSYPTLLDPGSRTAIDFGLYGVPETFFITPDGTIAHKHIGPVTAATLREWIERLRPDRVAAAEEAP